MQPKAIEVIRRSLAAANAALELLEAVPVEEVSVQQAIEVQAAPALVNVQVAPALVNVQVAPAIVEAVVNETPVAPLADRLYGELRSSRFDLRTEVELMAKFGISRSADLHAALNDMDEDYVTKNRRSDGAPLVGLESRN